MKYLMGYFIKRLPRENYKSLSVSALALALVFLINLLGGIKVWQEAEYEDIMENFPIFVEVSDNSGSVVDMLFIGEKYINLFTDPDENFFPLSGYLNDVLLKRTLDVTAISGAAATATLTGISDPRANGDAHLSFFDGYDENILKTGEPVCLVSEDILEMAEDGLLRAVVKGKFRTYTTKEATQIQAEDAAGNIFIYWMDEWVTKAIEPKDVQTELKIIGMVTGAGSGVVYCPFLTASELGLASDGYEIYTDKLAATVAANRDLVEFKKAAWWHFPRVGPIYDNRNFSLTIYDSQFYDETIPLMQNIILIDAVTPFVYIASVAIGFIASYLLTRRRKQEFAVMRSVGINKRDIFFGALFEQAVLCAIGAVLGTILVLLTWGYISFARPAVFLACYITGAAFSAVKAAGANVLKILREKE